MKSIADRVTPKDKKTLALFYESEAHSALLRIIKLMKANAGKHSLTAPDWDVVKHLQGQAFSLVELKKLLDDIYKKQKS